MLERGVEVFLIVVVRTRLELLLPLRLLFRTAIVQRSLFIHTRLDLLQNRRFFRLRLGRPRVGVRFGTSVKL